MIRKSSLSPMLTHGMWKAIEYVSIAKVEYDIHKEEGLYPVTFTTGNGTKIERMIFVVDQPFVKNEKANEAVMAFNFQKTVDEIQESQALDKMKTWANAQGSKLSDENTSVDLSVDYDFDPEHITEGVYKITFWTTGRELKIHTTDYSEEGQEVGLTFFRKTFMLCLRWVTDEEIFSVSSSLYCLGDFNAGTPHGTDRSLFLYGTWKQHYSLWIYAGALY